MDMFPVQMVDMAKTPEEIKEDLEPVNPEYVNKYPYGLCLCLDNDSLAKLGLDGSCEVDDGVQILAYGRVTSVSDNDTVSGSRRRVEIQITHMALGPDHYMMEDSDAA